MSAALDTELQALRDFVGRFQRVPDLQFEAVPYPLRSHEGIGYLLLVASLNQGAPAEFVRGLVRHLYDELGDDLLDFDRVPLARQQAGRDYIQQHLPRWMLATDWAANLAAYSQAIRDSRERSAGGLTLAHVRPQSAATLVDRLAQHSRRPGHPWLFMGGPKSARKRLWMFLRWMVRDAPDLGVWQHVVSPRELMVPFDVNVAKAFYAFRQGVVGMALDAKGLHLDLDDQGKPKSTLRNAQVVTALGQRLFPDDPARIDYAFFCFGRRENRQGDTCWRVLGNCEACPVRRLVKCPGYGPRGRLGLRG